MDKIQKTEEIRRPCKYLGVKNEKNVIKKQAQQLQNIVRKNKATGKPPQQENKNINYTSDVWVDGVYERVIKDDGTVDKTRVRCCQCNLVMSKHPRTTNIIYHMERKHNEFWTNVIAQKKNNQPKVKNT